MFHEIIEVWKNEKKELKMTRNDYVNKIKEATGNYYGSAFINAIEALGLIKFEEEIQSVFKLTNDDSTVKTEYIWDGNKTGKEILKKYGAVKIELWPEGLVLWVGGEIVYKSWEKYYKKGDATYFEYYNPAKEKQRQAEIITT